MDEKGRMEGLIERILDIEWEMFTSVPARGGREPCQDDPATYRLIRVANFHTWSDAALASYLTDLEEARRKGRNLITLKYARMEGSIPPLSPESAHIIERIVRRECEWAQEFREGNPEEELARPVWASEEKGAGKVSSETYLRCELETYSPRTLDYYYQDTLSISARGENRVEAAVRRMREMSAGEGRG